MVTPISELLDANLEKGPQTLVSVQSVSLGTLTQRYLPSLNHFEDRNFYLGEFLRQEGNCVLFVVSNDPDEAFVEYQLDTVAECLGVQPSTLAEKISILRISNVSQCSLTQSLLENADHFDRLKEAVGYLARPILDFWSVSRCEIELARRLGLPYLGPRYDAVGLDQKSSARKVFSQSGITHPLGREDIFSVAEVQSAVQSLVKQSDASAFLIKLNDEEAGNGIAKVPREVADLPIDDFRSAMSISKDIPYLEFEARLVEDGCVVEEFIHRDQVANPSVKMFIGEDGRVTNLATHDQILTNMAYSGCMFPADAAYRSKLIELGYQIANVLVMRGVKGIFSVDFLAGRNCGDSPWSLWALEINIRKGATTHPYFWTRLLANAEYFEEEGVLRNQNGEVVYTSSEYVHADGLNRCTTGEIIDAIRNEGIEFSQSKRSGVFIHMGSCVREYSKFGATIIATNQSEAVELLKQLQGVATLLAETRSNLISYQ